MVAPRALSEFIAEANEILETLGRELLTLEESGLEQADPDRLNAVFRAAHSLKGLSAMFGLESISKLAHRAEDLLDALRLGKTPHGQVPLLDALGQTVDVLQEMLGEASRGDDSDELKARAETLGHELQHLAGGGSHEGVDVLDQVGLDPQVRAVFTEYEEHRLRENVKKGVGLW